MNANGALISNRGNLKLTDFVRDQPLLYYRIKEPMTSFRYDILYLKIPEVVAYERFNCSFFFFIVFCFSFWKAKVDIAIFPTCYV